MAIHTPVSRTRKALWALEEALDNFIRIASVLLLCGLIYVAGYISGQNDAIGSARQSLQQCGSILCPLPSIFGEAQ